jgi:hypothetical protein
MVDLMNKAYRLLREMEGECTVTPNPPDVAEEKLDLLTLEAPCQLPRLLRAVLPKVPGVLKPDAVLPLVSSLSRGRRTIRVRGIVQPNQAQEQPCPEANALAQSAPFVPGHGGSIPERWKA